MSITQMKKVLALPSPCRVTYRKKDAKMDSIFILTPVARLVLLVLAWHCDDEGHAWPSQQTLANECGACRRTVAYVLTQVEDCGWLTVKRNYVGNIQTVSDYILKLPATVETPAAQPLHSEAAPGAQMTTSRCADDSILAAQPLHTEPSVRHPSVQQPSTPPPTPKATAPTEQADAITMLGTAGVGFFNRLKAERPSEEAKARQNLAKWIAAHGTHHVARALAVLTAQPWTDIHSVPSVVPKRLENLERETPDPWMCDCQECTEAKKGYSEEEVAEREARAAKKKALAEMAEKLRPRPYFAKMEQRRPEPGSFSDLLQKKYGQG